MAHTASRSVGTGPANQIVRSVKSAAPSVFSASANTAPLLAPPSSAKNTNIFYAAFGGSGAAKPLNLPVVDVPTIGKVAGGIVFLVCALSFSVWKLTGFYLIYPPFSLLIGAIGALFFGINVFLRHQWSKNGSGR